MSTGSAPWRGPRSSTSRYSSRARQTPSVVSHRPPAEMSDSKFEPCAATAAFLLYAERNVVVVLHHDTLAIERRFALHREEIVWVIVDNASERGSGRIAVSYDAGNTAIVWDILNGGEVARFSAYEHMRVACFMRNGNIAFGNDQGNIILFEPSTSEHISARTIFDPITSLAPASDCHTFAIGYLNGSILIATLQPSFTILHTLTTSRAPAPIAGLGWHGSSSKQKTDMLASQTSEGDLRVWSVPKGAGMEPPAIIRVLQRPESRHSGPCWFSWSKSGRIIQHAEGETRAWDVRTKKVSWTGIPTIDGVIGMANHGPSATLFTLTRGHCVQQYDITPDADAVQVASVQHVPTNTPPTPPSMLDDRKSTYTESQMSEQGYIDTDESGADEPIRKLQTHTESLDALESELRDKVMPLSPTSSRASSRSSRSSRSRRGPRRYLYDKPDSSRASSASDLEGTEFSISTPLPRQQDQDAMSIRSASSFRSAAQSRSKPATNLKNTRMQPAPSDGNGIKDIFPRASRRLIDVPFRTPHYGNVTETPESLQREMLITVFGWSDTAEALIIDELEHLPAGSINYVLLSRWMGYDTKESLDAMVSAGVMGQSDWMILALVSLQPEQQKQVGEAFVQRLLEARDVHPAASILIGMGEINDAIEVYVTQKSWMEAIILICLFYPSDWLRTTYLLRKWGETAVQNGQAELAVRLFSCSSFQATEPSASAQAQDPAFVSQNHRFTQSANVASPPMSPPSTTPSRLKNASLRLITSFNEGGDAAAPTALDDRTPMQNFGGGVTPIAQSAMPRSAMDQSWARSTRDLASARGGMTPGGARKRLPSFGDIERTKLDPAQMATPITAAREVGPKLPGKSRTHSRRGSSISSLQAPDTAVREAPGPLPSPAHDAFTRLREQSQTRKDRNVDGLTLQMRENRYDDEMSAAGSTAQQSLQSGRTTTYSPLPAETHMSSSKARAIGEYINNVEMARESNQEVRAQSKRRGNSQARSEGRPRHTRRASEDQNTRYSNSGKRSPSSPIPMSPEEIAEASRSTRGGEASAIEDDLKSPIGSQRGTRAGRAERRRPSLGVRAVSEAAGPTFDSLERPSSYEDRRGRSQSRSARSRTRSPSTMATLPQTQAEQDGAQKAQRRARSRAAEGSRERRAVSRSRRERSSSRKPGRDLPDSALPTPISKTILAEGDSLSMLPGLSKKQLAAKELEDRRLSLARRPSAPAIPLPGELSSRPGMSPRSYTEQSPGTFLSPYSRSASVDPEAMMSLKKTTGISTSSTPIGLPATPRAMRHPRHAAGNQDDAPPVPDLANLSSLRYDPSASASNLASNPGSELPKSAAVEDEGLGPLLPATVFGQKAPARSASAPPEKFMGNPHSVSSRRMSAEKRTSPQGGPQDWHHEVADDDPNVIVVPEPENPPVLPELQHLAGPPPPPPVPVYGRPAPPPSGKGSGMINIAIDDNATSPAANDANEPSMVLPSSTYGNSIDRAATSQGFGSRFRGTVDRMRSSSRTRTKSSLPDAGSYAAAPYESIPPIMPAASSQDAVHRAKSPYEKAMAAQMSAHMHGQDPNAPFQSGLDRRISETVIPPSSLPARTASAMGGRNPRELRANMPPDVLQQGAHMAEGGYL